MTLDSMSEHSKIQHSKIQTWDVRALQARSLQYVPVYIRLAALCGVSLLCSGCAEPSPAPSPSSKNALSGVPNGMHSAEAEPRAESSESEMYVNEGAATGTAMPRTPPDITPPPTNSAAPEVGGGNVERVTADVGVGQRGRTLDQYQGGIERMIVEPARTLFAVRERMVFSAQIPQALQLYKATNGRGPISHEDFMRDIVQANNIRLPDLPPGQRYIYDPTSEELLVERPAR